jgi:spore coat-associated protein N
MARGPLLLTALAVAAMAAIPHRGTEPLLALTASGALRLDNSHDGAALLSAPNMRPGDSAAGAVTVTNRGADPVRLRLHSSVARGGPLGEVLLVSVGGVAEGSLRELAGCHDLGTLAAGEARTYRFAVRLPREVGNAYARTTASADERWVAGAGCGGPVAAASRARAAISHRRVALVGGRARLAVRCSGPAGERCTGSAALGARSWRSRRLFVASAGRFDVAAGRAGTVDLRVPADSRALLRVRGKAVAVATLRGPAGTRRRLVTLIVRPKPAPGRAGRPPRRRSG